MNDSGAGRVHWRHWWMVSVLAGLTILSFIDRNALVILIEDVKHKFDLTDGQSGLLLGTAFAFLYAFAGLPAGYLVDRFDRRKLIILAVAFWSIMTAFSGLATSFGLLFLGRMGVGFGEAFLSPAAGSLIRNAIPLNRRALAFGILNACSSAGGGVALVVVGGLVAAMPDGGVHLPVLGQLSVWQMVFLTIGIVGFPFAFLTLSFPEPERQNYDAAGQPTSMRHFVAWLGRHKQFYGAQYAAMALGGIGTYGFSSWMPTALARKWEITPAAIGVTYGTLQIAASLAGIAIGATLTHLLMQRAPASVALRVSAVCTVLAAISAILTPLMPTPALTWAFLALQWLVVPTSGVGAFTSLTAATPNYSMGKVMALGYLSHSVVGYGLGPTLVAAVGDHLFDGSLSIGYGIAIVSGTALMFSAALYLVASRHLVAAQSDSDSQ